MVGIISGFLLLQFFQVAVGAAPAVSTSPDPDRPIRYDFVILALSWSPTYCASSVRRGQTDQCQNPANRGFVVHGFWPQSRDGARLRCAEGRADFSKALFERALQVFPDLDLAEKQFQRHGECFEFSPDSYLDVTAQARSKIVVPDFLRALDRPLSIAPEEIRSAFANSNSGLSRDSISVSCRKSTLVEVLICMKSDLSGFEPCPQVVRRTCRGAMIEVPASLRR